MAQELSLQRGVRRRAGWVMFWALSETASKMPFIGSAAAVSRRQIHTLWPTSVTLLLSHCPLPLIASLLSPYYFPVRPASASALPALHYSHLFLQMRRKPILSSSLYPCCGVHMSLTVWSLLLHSRRVGLRNQIILNCKETEIKTCDRAFE